MGSLVKAQTALVGDSVPNIILVHDAPVPDVCKSVFASQCYSPTQALSYSF